MRFELTVETSPTAVFKTAAFNRSATSPSAYRRRTIENRESKIDKLFYCGLFSIFDFHGCAVVIGLGATPSCPALDCPISCKNVFCRRA